MSEDFRSKLHEVLRAHEPHRMTLEDARDAAVLIPIVARPAPTLLFTVRTDTLSSHKGQIAFPGGAIDPGDGSPAAAALREANEEVGIDPAAVEVIGELDAFPTFVSGYVVTPVVGWLPEKPSISPNPAEVADVLHVPVADLIDDIRSEAGFTHAERTYPTEAWIWHDHVIWGVTARILRSFLGRLAQAGLTSPPGKTTSWTAWPLDDRPVRDQAS
jgi:8-oxo-dGTP pyrophosphatase MutT (NUDIX family)